MPLRSYVWCKHELWLSWHLSSQAGRRTESSAPKPQSSLLPQTFISVRQWRDPTELLLFPLGVGERMCAQDSMKKLVLLQLLEFKFCC